MSTQQTLTGDDAVDRTVPKTLLRCPECGERVLRSNRFTHRHDLSGSDDVRTAERKQLEEQVPAEARIQTRTYRVEFTYEYREVVDVEAADKHEARRIAEEKQTLRGNYVDTLHSRTETWSEKSTATLEYLETQGLLPDDHDVTQSDIEAVMES